MKRKIGVVLSGCGFLDGSEVHEAVLAMLYLDEAGCDVVCLAPRGPQAQVVDHETRQPRAGEQRDMLKEAARIARGQVRDLAAVAAAELDAVVLPGGFGAAKNLSDFASKGAAATVRGDVADLLRRMHAAGKPIGAICIAPAVVAAVLGTANGTRRPPTLTIGTDAATAGALAKMGAIHRNAAVHECVVDDVNRIVSAPAYMYDARISEVAAGIRKLVKGIVAMLDRTVSGCSQ